MRIDTVNPDVRSSSQTENVIDHMVKVFPFAFVVDDSLRIVESESFALEGCSLFRAMGL